MLSQGLLMVLLFQEFGLEIHDKKGTKNQVAGHLSSLEGEDRIDTKELPIDNYFPNDQLWDITTMQMPWNGYVVTF